VGSSTLFFNLPFPGSHSADGGWLVSIWCFLSPFKVTLIIPGAEIPKLQRAHDGAIMVFFNTLGLKPAILCTLNRCRVHLQIIFLPDITGADGKFIIPEILLEQCHPDRYSSLQWPNQLRPPAAAWVQWRTHLQSLHWDGKLHNHLGEWIHPPHQQWGTVLDQSTGHLYCQQGKCWSYYNPTPPVTRRLTRSSTRPHYNLQSPSGAEPPPGNEVPATVLPPQYGLLPIVHSGNSIPNSDTSRPNTITSFAEVKTHPYYVQLLAWDSNFISPFLYTLGGYLHNGYLVIYSNSCYDPNQGRGSHAWVFSSSSGNILWHGSGPTCGHPETMTAYRAKLSGITSILYILNYICRTMSITEGSADIYCDNTSSLAEVFCKPYISPNPYKQLCSDVDLLKCARYLIACLPHDVMT
jgi:hypothetical protein